ncbi:EF-hand domain-containing protein [Asticcacaulis sp. AC402]|uniref:EF-hand domain-containing protein n=1 Tax=Asticcacaulis sp. AC402 TaxID=1282361 RepID=UPI0003C3D617|nr:EF-hand domain-containing protein [Asticcacaulis sp. AC402]ESQ74156.1 hypothetical protein ABAC402_16025 [Asticcacaulis sp. AC402]
MTTNKFLNTFASIFATSSLLIATPSLAQSGERFTTMLMRADSNRNGEVTWAEFAAERTEMFDRLDRNHDGYVDSKDRPRLHGSRFDEAFKALSQLDSNADRRISRAELQQGKAPSFDAADANKNRVLDAKEIASVSTLR